MSNRTVYSILAYLGALPFAAAAILSVSGVESLRIIGRPADVALSYGLAIICFLAGAHWATYLYRSDSIPKNLFITSNVVVLAAWIPYLISTDTWAAAAQVLAFAYLLYIDRSLLRIGLIEAGYFRVRSIATTVAVVSLAAIWFMA